MSRGRRILIGVIVVVLIGAAAVLSVVRARKNGIEVRMDTAERRDLVATVTTSGNIRARRKADISSDVSGRIVDLMVEEGDQVQEGQVLLRLDQTQYKAAVGQAEATLSQTRAIAAQQEANFEKAKREQERISRLWARDSALVSRQQFDDAETSLKVAQALLQSSQHGVEQSQAALEEAEDRLSKTTILAPISGTVTRLNVDLGETVIVGTMNNPGSLILTISDLSIVEAVMEVDETDVPEISLGDSAAVDIDAFPDREFSGKVTKIGSSAIRPPEQFAGSGQTATIDFEVVITLDDPPAEIRPDLSASADIVTAVRKDALSVPIIALTVRERDAVVKALGDSVSIPEAEDDNKSQDVEGVFVVHGGTAQFVPVKVGIAGQEHFEILSGVEEGDTVVSGPYQRIRQLAFGAPVKRATGAETGEDGS